jgi:hypothetical protein
MAEFLQARGMWDNPAFKLSDAERSYVESVPTVEAVRMLREVGFHAGATGEMLLDKEDIDVAAWSTLSVHSTEVEFNPGYEIAEGYKDSQLAHQLDVKYGRGEA